MAPTIAFLMDIPGPQNARGQILYDLVEDAGAVQRDHDPRHQRLPRPADPAGRGGRQPGGSGRQPDLRDRRRRRSSRRGSTPTRPSPRRRQRLASRVAAGDSVGATPPISAFFGDKPTIEIMNMMGIDADGLGNHNFDRGAGVLPQHADSARRLPVLSANIVDAEWQDTAGVVAVEGVQLRRRQGRLGRLHQGATPRHGLPGRPRPVPVAARSPQSMRRRRSSSKKDRRDRRNRPRRVQPPGRSATRRGR